ncbi:MAG TPA: LiaF domain-containing protein [Deinococcales bacterium]|nr:LiaF domain-containing protein [Deinococcales bacterium]
MKHFTAATLALLGATTLTSCVLTGRLHTESLEQTLGGAREAHVTIAASVAELSVEAVRSPAMLLEGTADIPDRSRIDKDFRLVGGTAYLSYRERGHGGPVVVPVRNTTPRWEIGLSRDVPLDLELKTGFGESNIDLSDLQVRSLEVSAGVGEADITMPARGSIEARVQSGVGEVTVHVPRGMAVRVRGKTGLGDLHVSGRDMNVNDGEYRSRDYDDASNRLDLYVKAGIGQVDVILD